MNRAPARQANRFSIGIEAYEDIEADLKQALEKV